MPPRVGEYFRVGGMVGTFNGDDGAAQGRVLVAQVGRKLLLGLRRPDHQNFVRALERMRGVIEKMAVGRRLVTAVGAFAVMHALMLFMRVNNGALLLGRRELPNSRLLMVDPNDRMVV